MSSELSKVVLGSLIMAPWLIEDSDLSIDDFPTDRMQKTFEIIAKFWEDSRPEKIDTVLLGEHLGGDGAFTFVSGLLDGLQGSSPEQFQDRVAELKRRGLAAKILMKIEKMAKSGELELEEVRHDLEEYDSLSQKNKNGLEFDMAHLTDIEMKGIQWLWYPVAPKGMLASILGEPGIAKTYVLVDLCARISNGQSLPIYRKITEKIAKGWIIYITSEGVPDKILKPRLYAAKADMKNITLIKGIYNEREGGFQLLDIQFHLPALKSLILKERDAGGRDCVLVVIDPIASFVSARTNLNDMSQTRQALDIIARFAEESNVAVIVAIHPNKDETKKLMSRASGSVQMSAAVKSAWIIAGPKDDDPPNLRYFAPYKITIAPFDKNETLPFFLEDASFTYGEDRFEVAKIRWSENLTKVDVERIISPRANEGINMAAKARALLREKLSDGPKPGTELIRIAEESGIRSSTVYKAKADLGIEDGPVGYQGQWLWFLPKEGASFKEDSSSKK